MSLSIAPLTLRKANDFVAEHHRHSGRTARNGGKFAVGAYEGDELVGIAIVGNPLSATLMDGVTAEVTRVCVTPEAPKNTCSFLYGRCWRIWQQMGGKRLVTYTLQSESGSSLRGAGWKIMGEVKPHNRWSNKADGIERQDLTIYRQPKFRWEAA
jgi:hypothetical protein